MAELSNAERIKLARRLKWLCGEMATRLEETKEPTDFGHYGFTHAKEAEEISKSLGFTYAPIGQSQTNYGPDNPRIEPMPHLGQGVMGQYEMTFGCEATDPTDETCVIVTVGSIIHVVIDGKPRVYDIFSGMDKRDSRAGVVKFLRQWARAMDGIIESSSEATQERRDLIRSTQNNQPHPRQEEILKILGNLPPRHGLTAKEILDRLSKNTPKPAESTLRRHILTSMKSAGEIENTRGIGYHLPERNSD
jgi:hypothetical protein